MARRSLQPGDPLRAEGLLRPGESGFLAAVLTPGLRAVTVGVDMVTGAAGLIWPGDRVDLILAQQLEDHALPAARRHLGEVVLEAARVIAVDRHFVQGAQPGSGELMRDPQRTVTFEVTAEQSTRVALAGRMGRLSLALRAAGTPAPGAGGSRSRAGAAAAGLGRRCLARAAARPGAASAAGVGDAGDLGTGARRGDSLPMRHAHTRAGGMHDGRH
jgi:pilus assembly protein CpaB